MISYIKKPAEFCWQLMLRKGDNHFCSLTMFRECFAKVTVTLSFTVPRNIVPRHRNMVSHSHIQSPQPKCANPFCRWRLCRDNKSSKNLSYKGMSPNNSRRHI